eukprot:168539_1
MNAKAIEHYYGTLLRQYFGEVVQNVGIYLFLIGRSSVEDIVKGIQPRLELIQVKDALMVLQQHNLLETGPFDDPKHAAKDADFSDERMALSVAQRAVPQFELDVCALQKKSRFARYASHVDRKFAHCGAFIIIEELAAHGRATPSQLQELYQQRVQQALSTDDWESGNFSEFFKKFAKNSAEQLQSKAKDAFTSIFSELHGQSYLIAVDPKRRSIDHLEPPSKRRRGNSQDQPSDFMSSTDMMVHHDRFTLDFRTDAICEYVATRYDATCSQVVRAMLHDCGVTTLHDLRTVPYVAPKTLRGKRAREAPLPESVGVGQTRSSPPVVDSERVTHLLRAVCSHPPQLRRAKLNALAQEMTTDRPPTLLRPDSTQVHSHAVNLAGIVHEMRLLATQAILKAKFGLIYARIFRLLVEKKQLEDSQVSDLALVPRKQARKCLFEMLQSKFVHLQEIPRSVGDQIPGRTFFLWSAQVEPIFEELIITFYKTWTNLQLHRAEIQKPSDSLSKMSENVANGIAQERVDLAQSRIDEQIMLFRDF